MLFSTYIANTWLEQTLTQRWLLFGPLTLCSQSLKLLGTISIYYGVISLISSLPSSFNPKKLSLLSFLLLLSKLSFLLHLLVIMESGFPRIIFHTSTVLTDTLMPPLKYFIENLLRFPWIARKYTRFCYRYNSCMKCLFNGKLALLHDF